MNINIFNKKMSVGGRWESTAEGFWQERMRIKVKYLYCSVDIFLTLSSLLSHHAAPIKNFNPLLSPFTTAFRVFSYHQKVASAPWASSDLQQRLNGNCLIVFQGFSSISISSIAQWLWGPIYYSDWLCENSMNYGDFHLKKLSREFYENFTCR